MTSEEEFFAKARLAPWHVDLEPPRAIRGRARRRKTLRRVAGGTVAAVGGLVVLGLVFNPPWGNTMNVSSTGEQITLVFSIPDQGYPLSQTSGVFTTEEGCLYLSGLPVVLPSGSRLEGDLLEIEGLTNTTATIGEQVTVGGVRLEMSKGELDNIVEADGHPVIKRCASKVDATRWVLIT